MIRKTLIAFTLGMTAAVATAQVAPSVFDQSRLQASPRAGSWTYAPLATGSEARFGSMFVVRCDRVQRRVLLQRIDRAVTAPLTVSTDTLSRAISADGWLANTDPMLAAIAFSRGRIVVDGAGADRLILPSSPEAARSIEDCLN